MKFSLPDVADRKIGGEKPSRFCRYTACMMFFIEVSRSPSCQVDHWQSWAICLRAATRGQEWRIAHPFGASSQGQVSISVMQEIFLDWLHLTVIILVFCMLSIQCLFSPLWLSATREIHQRVSRSMSLQIPWLHPVLMSTLPLISDSMTPRHMI